ncbi:hypothetical protein [Streptomyces sp. NPDC054794]
MSDLGELDRPGTPSSPGAWDAPSEGWRRRGTEDVGEPEADDADAWGADASGRRDAYGSIEAEPERSGAREPDGFDMGEADDFGTGDSGAPDRSGAAPVEVPEWDSPRAVASSSTAAAGGSRVGAEAGRGRRPAARRGAADPVKALMHRHRELCERAVDPLEIAAGLEAHGITDRTAARFRHRDVFSLAEEMYARVSRDGDGLPHAETATTVRARADWALLTLLPGALSAAVVAALHLTHGRTRLLAAAVGVLAVVLALRAALRRGPLSTPPGTHAWATAARTRACVHWLLAYALLGDGLLLAVLRGGPDSPPTGAPDGSWPLSTAPVLALVLACAPAAWTAHLFAARARRRLAASRGLEEFTAAARPLLFGAVTLFLGALTVLAVLCGTALHEPAAYPEVLTLGALLLVARLLAVHHHPHAAAHALAAAVATEAAAPALVLGGRLPGCAFLSTPVETLVDAWGVGSVPALACGAAALALLGHATRTLTRASAHAATGEAQ